MFSSSASNPSSQAPFLAPNWTFHRQFGIPPYLGSWLWDADSLTAKLIALSNQQFAVEILRQVYAPATLNEYRALGIRVGEPCLIREVVLRGKNQPWVFARSVLPLSSLTGRLRQLRWQGSKPLGAFLFNQPDLQRSPIAISCLRPRHRYVPTRLQAGKTLWGRRSVFFVDKKPLLVSEVFLSPLVNLLECQSNLL